MKRNEAHIARLIAVFSLILTLLSVWLWLQRTESTAIGAALHALGWNLTVGPALALLGALIVTRRPGNMVGWVMLLGALGTANPAGFLVPATSPGVLTVPIFLAFWLEGWSWIPAIFALFLIPLYFPTGRLPTSRWRWVPWLAVGLWLLFAVLTLFVSEIGPLDESWDPLPNPIGFLSAAWFGDSFLLVWFIGLITLLGGSVVSLYGRYRRAEFVERQQIKWLLLAGVQFVIVYSFAFFNSENNNFGNYLLLPSAMALPVAVAIAILRYRLWNIDVIIRKTLVYAVLSSLLALIYFGMVVLLQSVFEAVSGQQSPIVIVISTLAIAALFSPLRQRVQTVIDRRFYRQKYDAQQVLAHFAQTARDEVSLEALTAELTRVVQETMQPEQATIWLRMGKK